MENILLYQSIHSKLYKKYGNSIIDIKIIKNEILGRIYRIEKPLRCLIIKEMITYNMFKKINNESIEILPTNFNPSECYNELCLKLGVYE